MTLLLLLCLGCFGIVRKSSAAGWLQGYRRLKKYDLPDTHAGGRGALCGASTTALQIHARRGNTIEIVLVITNS
jgi:hypothetical protein